MEATESGVKKVGGSPARLGACPRSPRGTVGDYRHLERTTSKTCKSIRFGKITTYRMAHGSQIRGSGSHSFHIEATMRTSIVAGSALAASLAAFAVAAPLQ